MIGIYFFEQTVTSDSYRNLIKQFIKLFACVFGKYITTHQKRNVITSRPS